MNRKKSLKYNLYNCVASGSYSQDNLKFGPRSNSQCVCISVCAATVAQNICGSFDSQLINTIIDEGDKYYQKSKHELGPSHNSDHLQAREVYNTLNFQNKLYEVNVFYESAAIYPYSPREKRASIDKLTCFIEDECSKNTRSGYIFIGLSSAVSFWKFEGKYFLFNSHSVNKQGLVSTNGVSRLFMSETARGLASLLLVNAPCNGTKYQYEISRLDCSPSESNPNNGEERRKKLLSRPTVLAMDIESTSSDLKRNNNSHPDMPLDNSSNTFVQRSLDEQVRKNNKCSNKDVLPLLNPTINLTDGFEYPLKRSREKKAETILKPIVILTDIHNSPFKRKQNVLNDGTSKDDFPSQKKRKNSHKLRSVPSSRIELNRDSTKDDIRKNAGRPKKKKRGRPKTSVLSKKEQNLIANRKYTAKNPEVNRKAVKKYKNRNPQINIAAVKKYRDANPQVNRNSVRKYKKNNPGPHLSTPLRKGCLIGEYQGAQLKKVKPYRLKNVSLKSSNCHKCPSCGAPLFEEEKNRKQWCCGSGRFNVSNMAPLSAKFYSDRSFIENARLYNDMFSLCAFSVPSHFHHPKTGVSFIKILGRTYHKVRHLSYADPDTNLNKGSLYIHDEQARLLHTERKKLNPRIVKQIHEYLAEENKGLFNAYRRLYDEPSEEAHLVFNYTTRKSHGPILGDRPSCNEVAAILSTDTESRNPRELVVWKKGNNKPNKIYQFHGLVEPFQYPLLYPQGNVGWFIGRTDNDGNKLSQLKYIRCLLLSEDRFSKFGRLSENWLVDMYARIDEERLNYLRYSQTEREQSGFRIGPSDEVAAAANHVPLVTNSDNTSINNTIYNDETILGEGSAHPGKVFLPQSYTGGPRYMKKCYFHAMALVSRFGSPTYFLTFTANAGWQEIKKSRKHPQYNDPVLVNRVFQLKLNELLRDIKCGKFFGKISYIVWVIEFQMRGLPHAHICFRVEGGGPVQGVEIDRVIRADIPPDSQKRLRRLVLKHMIHGPCDGTSEKSFLCQDGFENKCSKFFPKPHTETTFTDNRGFVHFKRNSKNTAKKFIAKRNIEVNDCWVVPYNAALLLKYECHINLEIASAQKAVKYLFKYISKGSPLQGVAIIPGQEETDKIQEYVTKRYIGSSDAAWRILGFKISGRDPPVYKLQVHLEGKHSVVFRPDKKKEALEKGSSDLILYFNRPKLPSMDALTYPDFFENYVIHPKKPTAMGVEVLPHPDKKHFITRRQKGECVARLFWVPPSRGEQYYLRVLLSKYPCRGYNDLYSLGGTECTSFQEAARCLGLAHNNREYHQAMQEACEFMMPHRLRQFFVLLITNGAIAVDLWNKFKDSLCDDIHRQFPDDSGRALRVGLIEIDLCLRRQGSSLYESGLPVVENSSKELDREKLQYNRDLQLGFVNDWEDKLSIDQLEVFNYMKRLMNGKIDGLCRAIFLMAPGGYGKSLLLNVIAAYVRSLEKVVLCVATSGIAAQNISGGTTAQSMFKLPIDIDKTTSWSINNTSERADLIREASLIIFDEAPMAKKELVECLNRGLQDLMKNHTLFGGKIIIFSGDFHQIPPVVQNAMTPLDVINESIKKSEIIWPKLKVFQLTTAHRTGADNDYAKFLLEIGSNNVPQRNIGNTEETFVALNNVRYVNSPQALIDFVFPEDIIKNPDECVKRAIICTHNVNVKEFNEWVIQLIDGVIEELLSFDYVADEDNKNSYKIDETLLHQAQGKNVPDHILRLKVGSVCIIVQNLNFDMGLVNGTKVIITNISRRLVTVRKPGCNERFGIPRIPFKFRIFTKNPINIIRRQFPLQPCYAISVHKSQGQTIEKVGFDLRSDCFTHGQLYVGLSRVRSSENICVLVYPEKIIAGVAYTKNIVYEALLS